MLVGTGRMKLNASLKAIEIIGGKKNSVIGIGTGSTVNVFLEKMGEIKPDFFKDNLFVASSIATELELKKQGATILSLSTIDQVEYYIDGADAIDREKNMIKGGGAALFREKLLATSTKNLIIIVDETKIVDKILSMPIPVEVDALAIGIVIRKMKDNGLLPKIRGIEKGKWGPVVSDNGRIIVDVKVKDHVSDLVELERKIKMIPGVIETGLFIGLSPTVIVGGMEEAYIL